MSRFHFGRGGFRPGQLKFGGLILPAPPTGFTYLTDIDGIYLVDVDGAFLLTEI